MPLDQRYKRRLSTADKLHAVITAAATSVSPPPAKRTNDVLDELLSTPSATVAEATVECGGGTSVSESDFSV